jgi:ankyrin repeat protein
MESLHFAVGTGALRTTGLLLQACSDVNEPIIPLDSAGDDSLRGWTALHLAARRGDRHLAKLLIDAGACPNTAADSGCTPLHIAARADSSPVAYALLAAGAALNSTDLEGRTPLHVAARAGSLQMVRTLCGVGAAVDSRDLALRTPLHLAAESGLACVITALLASGADARARDGGGLTPLDSAASHGLTDALEALTATRARDNLRGRAVGGLRLAVAAKVCQESVPTCAVPRAGIRVGPRRRIRLGGSKEMRRGHAESTLPLLGTAGISQAETARGSHWEAALSARRQRL